MNLEDIMLGEVSLLQKDRFHIIQFMCQNHKDKVNSGCQELGEGRLDRLCLMRAEFQFYKMKYGRWWWCTFTTIWMYLTPLNCTPEKWQIWGIPWWSSGSDSRFSLLGCGQNIKVNFMLYVFYHNSKNLIVLFVSMFVKSSKRKN